jgi:hypothetical protein
MKKNIFLLFVLLSFNMNAANSEGKWYKFTENFIKDCVEEINEAKKNNSNRETNGISVSAIMGEISKDCLQATQAYNETDSQVTQNSVSNSCSSKKDGIFLLPVGTHNQTIKIISEDKNYTKEYTCDNGTWSANSSQSEIPDKTYCNSKCLSWNNGSLTECSVESIVGEVDSCGSVFPKSLAGSMITLKTLSDFKKGYATVMCNSEGNWVLKDYKCESDTCMANELVTWNDKEISDYYSVNKEGSTSDNNIEMGSQSATLLTNKINKLKEELSIKTANGHDVKNIINQLQSLTKNANNLKTQNVEEINTNNFLNPFEGNTALQRMYECQSKVVTSNGKYGYVKYLTEDNRIFKSPEEGTKNHNIVKGYADLVCDNGRWVFKPEKMECRRKESGVNCLNVVNLGKKNGERVNGYQCKNN